MDRKNIYKSFILVFLACLSSIAGWGQTKGDKYIGNGFISYPRMLDSQNNRDNNNDPIENAFDGKNGTYWQINNLNDPEKSGWIVLDLGENISQYLKSIDFTVPTDNEGKRQPTQVYVYMSTTELDGNANSWGNPIALEKNIQNELNGNGEFSLTISTNDSFEGRYLKIEFKGTTDDRPSSNSRVSEIDLNLEEGHGFASEPISYNDILITHKPAKWYNVFETSGANGDADSFDENEKTEPKKLKATEGGKTVEIQNAHTLVDTLYIKKGKTVQLTIPDWLNSNVSNRTYQRWYDYETGGTFATGNTGDNDVVDWLVPASSISGGPGIATMGYRFANGYVGQPMTSAPLYSMNFTYPNDASAKDHYEVACDVSSYNDYTAEYSDDSKNSKFLNGTEAYEPTLSHRFIFHIVAVGENDDDMPPVDVKNITMPAMRIPNNTQEMVALSRNAEGYTIPSNTADDNITLTATIEKNTAGISLLSGNNDTRTDEVTLSGEDRIIFFKYPTVNTDKTESVPDGSVASIVVKNGTKEVARFNLTFYDDDRLLTQSQVKQLNDNTVSGTPTWKDLAYRTPQSLKANYELLTELNFDYETEVETAVGNQPGYYPLPLLWSSSTYGFFDGSVNKGEFMSSDGDNKFPEWGYYAVTNKYMESASDAWNSGIIPPTDNSPERYNSSGGEYGEGGPSIYHLYADVSDRPGVIARLPFDRQLCAGTQLLVTAWVKSGRSRETKQNAGAMFTVMGVDTDGDGNKTYTPIYRYSTGQIPTTNINDAMVNLPGFDASKVENKNSNEWMQAYFSFTNRTDRDFESYALQIDNNSASTDGGDIYIDDIRVYIATVNPTVKQLDAPCRDEGATRVNVAFDYERLMSRLGDLEIEEGEENANEDGKTVDNITFCILDKDNYDAAAPKIQDGQQPTDEQIEQIRAAVNAAVEKVGVNGNMDNTMTLHFNLKYDDNAEYEAGGNNAYPATGSDGNLYFRRKQSDTERLLTTDLLGALKAGHSYYIYVANANSAGSGDWTDAFLQLYDKCAITSEFTVAPRDIIRLNGEVVNPETDYCAGQTYNFTTEVRVPSGNKDAETGQPEYIPLDETVYFDWFFGSEDEFTMKQSGDDYSDISLEEALDLFRTEYPDAEVVNDASPAKDAFTQDMWNLLKYYSEEKVNVGEGISHQHAHPLVLHQRSLNITLLSDGLKLVVRPIKIDLSVDNQDADVCWDYIPLNLKVSSNAPSLKPGFNEIKYPTEADNLDPALRIGLKQMESVSTTSGHSLIVDLRDARYSGINAEENVTGFGLIDDYEHLYLVSTDDPAYKDFFLSGEQFNQRSLVAGNITSLSAAHYGEGTTDRKNSMTVQFDMQTETSVKVADADGTQKDMTFKFTPKEGYTYNFAVYFEEKLRDGSKSTACDGMFVIPVKVVPEYVKWTGKATSNWNNDGNWQRVSSTEIKKNDYAKDDYLTDGTNMNIGGFVPMLFTKILMPQGSQAHLYKAGYLENGWDNTSRPEDVTEDPTPNIQYDLMAYGNESVYGKETTLGDITTERYRVNMCDQIHFEPGAELLRAEYLQYNRVWTDVEIPSGKWTLTGTPLENVVSGDWYTQASGRQATEYFRNITFTNTYDRLNPYVMQRSWGSSATIYEDGAATTSMPVSLSARWSAAYNDTYVPYSYGAGYSVYTNGIAGDTKALFRFPKNDTEYDFGKGALDRTDNGKLAASQMVQRNTEMDDAQETPEFTTTLDEVVTSADGTRYAIVGNPFMSHFDITKFLTKNTSVLKQKYWKMGLDGYPGAGTSTADGNWVVSDFGLAAPFEAFYVELADGVTDAKPRVTFTVEMETLKPVDNGGGETTTFNFMIKAANQDGKLSAAALAYDGMAEDAFVDNEDAQLMKNLSGNGNDIYVYTVAGNMAASVNRIKDLRLIPVGLFANDDDVTTVTFTGVAALLEPTLYDAETNTETALTEGYTLTIDGESHGRYFIRTRGAGEGTTDIEETVTDGGNDVNVYSVESGKVVVASDTELLDVMIYSVGGAVLKHETVSSGRTAITLDNVDSGVVIVKVTTADCTITRKIIVR